MEKNERFKSVSGEIKGLFPPQTSSTSSCIQLTRSGEFSLENQRNGCADVELKILKHSNRRQGKCSCPRSDSSPITCNTRDADFLPCLSPHQRQRWLHVHWFVRGGSNSHNSTQGNKIWIFFFFGKKTSLLSNRRDSGPGNEISTDTSTIPPSPPLRQQQKKKEPPEENTWKIKFVDSRKRNLDSNVDSSEALIPEHLSPQSPDAVGYVKRWTIFPRCHRRKTN